MESRIAYLAMFPSYYDAAKTLTTPEERCRFFEAILEYGFYGREIELEGPTKGLFILAKPNIDKSVKTALKNRENGKKGGAPPGNRNAARKKNNPDSTRKEPEKEKAKAKEAGEGHGDGGRMEGASEEVPGSGRSVIDFASIYARTGQPER